MDSEQNWKHLDYHASLRSNKSSQRSSPRRKRKSRKSSARSIRFDKEIEMILKYRDCLKVLRLVICSGLGVEF